MNGACSYLYISYLLTALPWPQGVTQYPRYYPALNGLMSGRGNRPVTVNDPWQYLVASFNPPSSNNDSEGNSISGATPPLISEYGVWWGNARVTASSFTPSIPWHIHYATDAANSQLGPHHPSWPYKRVAPFPRRRLCTPLASSVHQFFTSKYLDLCSLCSAHQCVESVSPHRVQG